jgi:hypothetical protein
MHVVAQHFAFAKWTAHRRHTANTLRRRPTRIRLFEQLETRHLLATAEGTPFALNESLDASELVGGLSASIDWGDGTVTSGDVSAAGGGSLVGHVDYSLDTNNFFDTQPKKDLFQLAVDTVLSHLGDDLAAIAPNGRNTWTGEFSHPGTGATHSITNLQVARNEIVIYAGGRDLGETIAVGGPGGFKVSCVDPSFCDVVATRGEPGARVQTGGPPPTDFGPWGGSVTFDTDTDFYFSPSLAGVGTQQSDFLSVAMHEIAHLLGFGTAGAWTTYASGGVFNGPASKAANGNQSVPLSSDGGHWKSGTMSNGQNVVLDPSLTNGTRRLLTALDFAGLDDIGWDLVPITAAVTGSHTYGDDGVYDIVAEISGSVGGTTSKKIQATVSNVSPTLTPADDQEVGTGQPFTISNIGVFTDPGFAASEAFTFTVDWGDGWPVGGGTASIDLLGAPGTATSGSFDAGHTYARGGTYTVTLTVADDDGGSDSKTLNLTAVTPHETPSWHNSAQPFDVNGDLDVSPIDVLQIVNDLNSQGSRQLPIPELTDVPPYLDVNNDGFTSPLDALLIVNFLNQGLAKSEGETSGEIVRDRQPLVPVATASTAVSAVDNHRRPWPSWPDSKRELVYFTDQLEGILADDLITDIVVANNRRADFRCYRVTPSRSAACESVATRADGPGDPSYMQPSRSAVCESVATRRWES